MNRSFHGRCGVRATRCALCLAVTVLVGLWADSARADDIIQVEEDWQLVVANPDPDNFAPQITTTMSPTGGVSSFYAVLDMNLKNVPSYEAGGLQLQIWNGGTAVSAVRSNTGTLLQNQNETITWTQRMALVDGVLVFSVVNGNSQTWGAFGTGITVAASANFDNLNNYAPSVSVQNSGIGYASNRVSSLSLQKVRTYTAAGLSSQDSNPKVLYPNQ